MKEFGHGKILPIKIEEEMKKSYIDYAHERYCWSGFTRCTGWVKTCPS